MKRYTTGLITGILLTASAFMFIGAATNQNHTHDATEITFSSSSYGGYGTLQKKIRDIDGDIDDKADEDHDHYYDYAAKSHTHNSFEIIGISDHSHYNYALSFHTHY
jgi:hypothetical protein